MTGVPGALLMLVTLGGLAVACGSPAPPPPTPLPQPAAATAPKGAAPAAKEEPQPAAEAVTEPPKFTYDSKGRRDPFETSQTREGTTGPTIVASAKLTGIVRSESGPLALVETPDGLGYILRPGDTLGEGRLVEINRNNVVFSLPPKPGATTNRVVLTLPSE